MLITRMLWLPHYSPPVILAVYSLRGNSVFCNPLLRRSHRCSSSIALIPNRALRPSLHPPSQNIRLLHNWPPVDLATELKSTWLSIVLSDLQQPDAPTSWPTDLLQSSRAPLVR